MTETLHDRTRLDAWDGAAADLWLVIAIIQPFKLDVVTLALEALPGFGGMTVSDCRGFGREKLASPDVSDYTKKTRLDIAVAGRPRAIEIVRAIARSAHTGRGGDGKVFLVRLAGAASIHDFDVDEGAL